MSKEKNPCSKYSTDTTLRGVVFEALLIAAYENLYDVWYLSAERQAQDLCEYEERLNGQSVGRVAGFVMAWRRLNQKPLHLTFDKFGGEEEVQAFTSEDAVPYLSNREQRAPIRLPKFEEVAELVCERHRVLNPLQKFIHEHSPQGDAQETLFRQQLSDVIEWARRQ